MEQNGERNARAQIKFMDKNLPLEWNTEFVLPDYRSEISRLLWVNPTISVPTRYLGNGKADFACRVHYEVLYAGPDGALYGTEEEKEYHFSAPVEGAGAEWNDVEVFAELAPDAVVSRVIAPRKMAVRCRLHARVRGYAARNLSPRLKCDQPENVLRLCEIARCGRIYAGVGNAVELEDKMYREEEGALRVISARGSVFLPEVSAVNGGVRCKGEAVLTALCCCEEGGEPFAVTRRIPFDETVAVEEVTPDCGAWARGVIGAVRATVEEDGVSFSTEMTLEAEARRDEDVCYDRDVFLRGARAECRFAEEELWQDHGCLHRHFSVSGEMDFAENGIPAGARIIDGVAEAEVREKQMENGKVLLTGLVRCRVLYRLEKEYGTAEISFPFRVSTEASGETAEALCSVPVCRIGAERDRLRVDAELQAAVCFGTGSTVRALWEASFVQQPAAARGDIELCYPAEGETLWEVGKRYGIAPEELARANGIVADAPGEAESLSGVRYLWIP